MMHLVGHEAFDAIPFVSSALEETEEPCILITKISLEMVNTSTDCRSLPLLQTEARRCQSPRRT